MFFLTYQAQDAKIQIFNGILFFLEKIYVDHQERAFLKTLQT